MEKLIFPKFALSADFKNAVPTPWEQIKKLMLSEQVKNTCRKIVNLDKNADDYKEKKEALKRTLPKLMAHASEFYQNIRSNDNAIWNGLVCLDYDHLTEQEIEALRTTEPPCPGIILAGRSASKQGVFFIVEVPNNDHNAMQSMLQEVHDAYAHALKVNHNLDIANKLDICLDLARCRYLPAYDYIWWDNVQDFQSKAEQMAPYNNMYQQAILACSELPTDIPEGSTAANTYTSYAAKIKKITDNNTFLLNNIPTLGLSEEARNKIIQWTHNNVQTKKQQTTEINLYKQPIDAEALPLPFRALPPLMQTLIKPYPAVWQRSAAICLLPALSTAAGALHQHNDKPLVFQVALWGEPQTGKTDFSAKPATIVQKYIAKNDNLYRKQIREADKNTDERKLFAPKVIPFINSSQNQIMKYLQYAHDNTIMAYEGDLSTSLAGKDCAFLNLKSLLRAGFDGETVMMDYLNKDSVQASVEARLSALVVGTPESIFNYFNAQSTAEGNARRVIFVEHEQILKILHIKPFSEEQLNFVYSQLDRLLNLPNKTVYHDKIEQAADLWREKKQLLANQDNILWRSAQTPTEMFRRAAYLMYALWDFDNKKIKQCCEFAEWIAEYQYRSYINLTYSEQKQQQKKWQQKKAPSTQATQEDFNNKMLQELPNNFTKEDVFNYRSAHDYPHNCKSYHTITRWKQAGLIKQLPDKSFQKI